MSSKQHQETLDALRAVRERVTGNPEEARKFLVRVGLLNEDGSYSNNYPELKKFAEAQRAKE